MNSAIEGVGADFVCKDSFLSWASLESAKRNEGLNVYQLYQHFN
jgi:hypothetical protein